MNNSNKDRLLAQVSNASGDRKPNVFTSGRKTYSNNSHVATLKSENLPPKSAQSLRVRRNSSGSVSAKNNPAFADRTTNRVTRNGDGSRSLFDSSAVSKTGVGGSKTSSSVGLPPISKTGLILEDADDVDYSSSTKGGLKSQNHRHLAQIADNSKQIPKPKTSSVDRKSFNDFARKSKDQQRNVIDNSNKSKFRTIVQPLRSSPTPDSVHDQRDESKFKKLKFVRNVGKQSELPISDSEIKPEESPVKEQEHIINTPEETNNSSKVAEKDEVEFSALTPLQRCITAKRRQKAQEVGNGKDDFIVEIFAKDQLPVRSVINADTGIDTNEKIAEEFEKSYENNEDSTFGAETTDEKPDITPRTDLEPVERKENEEEEAKDDNVAEKENEPNRIVLSSETNSILKYEEDVLMCAEDVFITGLKLNESKYESSPITIQEAISVKRLLFGDVCSRWSRAWLSHPVTLSGAFALDLCHFSPSGVLSCLQAHYIQQHFFSKNQQDSTALWRPTQQQKMSNLSRAVGSILAQCKSPSQNAPFILCSASTNVQYKSTTAMPHDGITERIEKYSFDSGDQLVQFLDIHIAKFSSCKYFLVLLMYSAILTRTSYIIRQDMLNLEQPLIEDHASGPALVSLLLTGVAAPSWLNDSVDLRNDPLTRRGIATRVNCGILTCRHTNKNIIVESNLKTPKLPIWIVETWSYSTALGIQRSSIVSRKRTRFSVVFCSNRRLISDWKVERHFDLHWLLACPFQVERVKFTIDARTSVVWGDMSEDDFHSVETALRTKWSDIEVCWNGSNPEDFGFLPNSQTAVEKF